MEVDMDNDLKCDQLGCSDRSVWWIDIDVSNKATVGCSRHIGKLLDPTRTNRVRKITEQNRLEIEGKRTAASRMEISLTTGLISTVAGPVEQDPER
jgi:hypothetical protein